LPLSAEDDLEIRLRVTRRQVALQQRLGEAADRGERRLQLVRCVRHEIAADGLELSVVGHVVEDGDGTPELAQREADGVRLEHAVLEQDLALLRLQGAQRVAQQVLDVCAADRIEG
jgi:hypothetical protein